MPLFLNLIISFFFAYLRPPLKEKKEESALFSTPATLPPPLSPCDIRLL